ncbi:Calx-beta domain-containing protein [Shewanella khirikhana]|nr:Calx-beta domain-containing protein [Shewanella khirikhana]
MDAGGTEKLVSAGDAIPEGAVLLVADNTRFELELDDGTTLDEADAKSTAAQPPVGEEEIDPNALNEIEALQAQIAAGDDPTADLPETAAGGVTGNEGGSGYVTLSRTGSETLASSGFDTTGDAPAADTTVQETQLPGALDVTPPVITVVAPDNTTDDTPTITGTTDAEPGSTVTIVVTDSNGGTQTLTTTVNTDGTYSVDVIDPLSEGGYTADASVTDTAGNTGSATDNGDVVYPEVGISANQTDVSEGDTASFTVTLDQPATQDVTVNFTYSGTAIDGTDFTGVVSVVIPAGQTSVIVNIDTIDDALAEGSEDFTITITSVTGGNANIGGNNSATTNIVDEAVPGPEDTVTVTLSGPDTVTEGEVTGTYTVTLSEPAPAGSIVTLTYSYTTASGDDIVETTQAVIGADGTTASFTITTVDDVYAEGDEAFTVSVSGITNGGSNVFEQLDLSGASVETTIKDAASPTDPEVPGEEDTVTVTLSGPDTVTEGEVTGTYTVTLSEPAPAGSIVTLTYSYTTASGDDIVETTQAVIGADGTTASFTITTVDDVYAEGDEAFTVSVSGITNGGSNVFEQLDLSGASVETTIKDAASPTDPEIPGEEDTVTVTLSGPDTVTEGEVTGTYTVTLSEPAPAGSIVTLTYSYTTASGDDIVETTQAVIGADGTTASFTITTVDDVYAEGDEAFTVSVSGITNGGNNVFEQLDLSGASVETTIKDAASPTDPEIPGEEDTVTVTLSGPDTVTEGEVTGTYTVTLSEPAPAGSIVTLTYSYTTASGDDIVETTQAVIGADGTTASFTITTVDDVYAEGDEAFTVSVSGITNGGSNVFEQLDLSGASVETTIKDAASPTDPEVPGEEDTVTVTLSGPDTVTEGEVTGTYTVTLSEPAPAGSIVTLTYSYTTASGDDIVETTQAVIGADGTTATFTVDTINDGVYEGDEDFSVSVSTIQTPAGSDVFELLDLSNATVDTTILDAQEPPTVNSVTGNEVTEGQNNTFTVTLSNPSATETTVTLALSDGTAIVGTDTGTTYMVSFDGGANYVPVVGNSVTVPAGTASFLVQVATVDDTIFEQTENYTLTATANGGGASGDSTITDNDSAPKVASITGDTVVEGQANTFAVTLTNTASTDTTLTLTLASGTATKGVDFSGTQVTVVIDGVSQTVAVAADGSFSVTVPANTNSFSVQVGTTDDTIFELTENYTLSGTGSNGTVTGTSTITDNDSAPKVASITGDTVVEGQANTFAVTLTNTASTDTTLTLTLASGTATKGVDFSGTQVTVVIDGVSQTVAVAADGSFSVTVPANTNSFSVQVGTTDDTIFELTENYTLSGTGSNGTVTGTSTITDNDSAPKVASITGDTVVEGQANTFAVTLTNTASTDTTLTLTLASGTATKGVDFSGTQVTVVIDGVSQTVAVAADGSFSVTVPANTNSFSVQVGTTDDTIFELTENYTLSGTGSNGTVTGTSTITDNDSAPKVASITGDTVVEGQANTFAVTLTNTASTDTTLTLTLASGTATKGVDFSGTQVTVVIDGVSQTVAVAADGSFSVTVPANTNSFSVQVGTTDDTIFELTENYTLSGTGSNGTVTGTSTITDNDSAPKVASITGDTVVEGQANTFAVTLTNTASTDTTLTLTLASGTATKGVDFSGTQVTVVIDGVSQTVAVAADGSFSVTVPANTNSFSVQVGTTDDTIFELTENYTLSGTGSNGTVTGTSTITDNDSAPKVASITGDTVVEGQANTFAVTLTNTASTDTTLTLTLASGTATKGVDFSGTQVTVVIDGVSQTVAVAADGSFSVTVPANTNSFSVQVGTTDDTIFELTENYTLSGTGSNGTVTGTSTITDNDSAPKVASITGDTVVEGQANTFAVTLTNTASTDTTLTLTLASGTATKGVDFSGTQVTVVIDGVSQTVAVAADGSFSVTVPANTNSFSVQVGTTDDTIFELTENYTLSGTGSNGTVTGTSTITDNDSAPKVASITGDTVVEGQANTFAVTLTNTASTDTTLTLTLASGTATKGVDFSGTQVTVVIDGVSQTVAVAADGSFSVTVPANTNSFSVQVGTTDDTIFELTENYTLSGTGSNGTVTGTSTITDNDILGGATATLALQDADTDTADSDQDTDSQSLAFTASGSADITSFAFGSTAGITVTGLDGSISWNVDNNTGNLIGSIGGVPMIILSLSGGTISAGQTGNVNVTATLLDNLQHGSNPVDIDSISISGIIVNAIDTQNHSASGTVNLTVEDDEVDLATGDLNGNNVIGDYEGTGLLNTSGVDQGYSADLSANVNGWNGTNITFADSDITSNGKTLFYYVDPLNPDVLYAYTDSSATPSAYNAANTDQNLVFTLTADPNSDSYSMSLLQTIDTLSKIEVAELDGGEGGNSPAVYVGYNATNGTFDIDNDLSQLGADYELAFTLSSHYTNDNPGTVNGNTGGFGANNAFVDYGEIFVIDFAQDVASAAVNFTGAALAHFKAYSEDGTLLGEGDIASGDAISNLGPISYIELTTTGDGNQYRFQFTGTSADVISSSTEDVSLKFDVTVEDSDGDTTSGEFNINLAAPGGAPLAPTALTTSATARLQEADLLDNGLDSDSQNLTFKAGSDAIGVFQFGNFSNIQVSGINANVSWALNEAGQLVGTTMGREAIRLTLDWSRINAGEEGDVTVQAELLTTLPHSVNTDNLTISGIEVIGVSGTGLSATSNVTVTVADDKNLAVDDTNSIDVVVDSFLVSGIVANWTETNDGSHIEMFDGTDAANGGGLDNDSGLDQLRWGSPVGSYKSGYGFIDNDAGLSGQLALNEDIVLGTFTHYNWPTYSGTSITSAKMNVAFTLTDAYGKTTPVSLDLNFSHNETPNSDDPEASKDIVTVGQTSVTFNYEGALYTLQVIGFKDKVTGNVVTEIHTAENAANSYELVVRMVPGDGYTLPHTEGNVLTNDIVGADGAPTIIGVAEGDQTDTGVIGQVGAIIAGTYGNLILNADGTYTYQLTASANSIPASGDIETFTYTTQDSDGDKTSATLKIDVNPVNADGINIADADLISTQGSNLNDTIIVVNGESANRAGQKVLNATFGGGLSGIITDRDGNMVSASGANNQSHSTKNIQVVSGGDGNDHIETAKGNDVIYAGKTGAAGFGTDDQLELSVNTLSTHHIMTGTLAGPDSIVDTDGMLLSNDVSSARADVVNGGSGNDKIFGQSGSDILYGHTGDDYIDGGSHNDALRGGDGNDTLIGGLGDDVLRGDGGADTFVWKAGETGTDHIIDFDVNEDKLDLSDLLQGEESGNLEDFLSFSIAGGSTTIEIDADKDGNVDQRIVLDGVDLAHEYGLDASDETGIITNLLGNGAGPLIVDTQGDTGNVQPVGNSLPLDDDKPLHP